MDGAPAKDRNLIIVGDRAFATVAYKYVSRESRYEVVSFALEEAFLKRDALMYPPVVAMDTLADMVLSQSTTEGEIHKVPQCEVAKVSARASSR